jgi:hypothetical protein
MFHQGLELAAGRKWRLRNTDAISKSTLAALAACFRCTLAVFGKVAAAASMLARAPLTHAAVLGLLLAGAAMLVLAVLVALLASLDVLFVGSALIGHIEFSVDFGFFFGVNSRTRSASLSRRNRCRQAMFRPKHFVTRSD